jgi:hypothetical protein
MVGKNMKRVIIYISLLLAVVITLFLPIAALADQPRDIEQSVDRNPHRISPNVVTQYTGRNWIDIKSGERVYEYKARIDSAPAYIDDQLIDTTWHPKPDTKWEAGNNLFSARVMGSITTVTYSGLNMVWSPQVFVGGQEYKCPSAPTLLTVDPINENYPYNTLSWDYGVCERRLRLIEGMISETYVFRTDPGADIQIKSNTVKDDEFIGECPVFAYDALGNNIPISADKVVKAEDLKYATFPISIDPTAVYETSASDGYGYCNTGATWATEQADDEFEYMASTSTYTQIGFQSGGGAWLYRAFVYYDTSAIPDSATISAVNLSLYGSFITGGKNTALQVQQGMPTYPHDPFVEGDYNKTHYDANGVGCVGILNTSWSVSGYNNISFNSTGISWINNTGITKLILRTRADITNNSSENLCQFQWHSYEKGAGYRPYLEVIYVSVFAPTATTSAATSVAATTAQLNGNLSNDGGEACNVSFQYAKWNGSAWTGNITTVNQSKTTGLFNANVINLSPFSNYSYRAQAANSAGSGNGLWVLFNTSASVATVTTNAATNVNSSAAKLNGYLDNSNGGGNCTVNFQYAEWDGANWINNMSTSDQTGMITGSYFYANLSGLPPNKLFTFRSQSWNSYGQSNGSWLTFYTSLSAPIVETDPATYITMTTARLNGYLDSSGGEANSTVNFQYAQWNGSAWTGNTTTVNQIKTIGETFYQDLSSLPANTLYTFRTQSNNSAGSYNGSWLTFTTLNTYVEPSHLCAYPSATTVELKWERGYGAVRTMVRYKIGAYPTSTSDGSLVYNDIGGGYIHTGLTPGTNYYYCAWSDDGGGIYTADYASVMTTTLAGSTTAEATPSAPLAPNGWFGSPDYTHMSNLPGYDILNAGADSVHMPRNTAWMLLAILGVVVAGIIAFFVSKHNLLIAGLVSAVFLAMAGTQELISWWYVGIYIIFALSLSFKAITR